MRVHAAVSCGVVVACSIALAACRDGAGVEPAPPAAAGSSAAPVAAKAEAPAKEPTYLMARVGNADVAGSAPGSRATSGTLYLVDPAAPGQALKTIDLGVAGGPASVPPNVGTTQDIRLDRSTRRYTYHGESVAFFVKDGKAWKIELRTDLPHEPVQLSSLDTACRIAFDLSALPMSADGRDAWVKVDTAGPNGSCALGSTGSVFVRSTMSAATAPMASLPGRYVDALDDGTRNTLAFTLVTPAGLELFRPDFSRIGKVEGGDGVRVAQLMNYDYANPQSSFYRVDGTLRRLSWTATGATLAAPVYTFARGDFGTRNPVGHGDASTFYFADSDKLFKIAGAGQPSEIATIPGPPIYAIWVSDTHLVMWQADPGKPRSEQAASTIAKTGGKVMTVDKVSALGASAHKMIYLSGSEMHAVNFDGSGDTVLGAGPGLSTVVGNKSWVADLFYLESHVGCVPTVATDSKCGTGRIVQTNIDSLATIDIGAVKHSGSYRTAFFRFGGATMGMLFPAATAVPTFLSYQAFLPRGTGGSPSASDLYTWTPGVAGSLAQLTHDVP